MLHMTTKHTGQMRGMVSINTSPLTNPFCRDTRRAGKIPSRIYSAQISLSHARFGPQKFWNENGKFLSYRLLDLTELPYIRFGAIRLNAYGELINHIHYENILRIALRNPVTLFILFTRRKDIVQVYGDRKPDNLVSVYSSPEIDILSPIKPEGFDKISSQYTRKFAAQHLVDINCCKYRCKECMICYDRPDITHINELIR